MGSQKRRIQCALFNWIVLVLNSILSFVQLWASIKAVKVKLASILHDASAQLKQYAEACDNPEIRDMFLKDCESIIRQDAEVSLRLSARDATSNCCCSSPNFPRHFPLVLLANMWCLRWAVAWVRSRTASGPSFRISHRQHRKS